jgi:hypothetical protein
MPPRDNAGGPQPADAVTSSSSPPATTTEAEGFFHDSGTGRYCHADTVAGLHRRRNASWRMLPLDCGCRDPLGCRCDDPPLSDRQAFGAVAAAHHLLGENLTPIFDRPTLVALWRNGHHRLVDRVRGVDDYDLVSGD